MLDSLVDPVGEATYTCDAENKSHRSYALEPCGIGESQMMFIIHRTQKELAYNTEDIDCCDDDRACSGDYECAMEEVGVLEATEEDCHLGYETGKTGKTERGETGDHIAYAEVRHDFHQAAHLADVTCMGSAINHTDEGEEEGCHQTVGEHLKDSTGHRCSVEHEDGEEHHAAVGDGGVSVDILEVGLHTCGEGSVDDTDTCKDNEDPGEFVSGLRKEVDGDTEASVATEFH